MKDQVIYNFEEFLNVSKYTEYQELLERNYKLMQLQDVDIPGNAKLSIQDQVRDGSGRLVKYKIHKMFLEDTVENAIRNPDVWLQDSFNHLELLLSNAANK